MKLLIKGIVKITLLPILIFPMLILGVLDFIRSWGKGKLIEDEESWSWKISRWYP